MYKTTETRKHWQNVALFIVFLIFLMTSAIAISTEPNDPKGESLSLDIISHSDTNGERVFKKPLKLLESEYDYSFDITFC